MHAMTLFEVTDDIYGLAYGLDPMVTSYTSCIINGIWFHMKEHERHCHTQNNGRVVHVDHQGLPANFYVVLQDIIELRYMDWPKVYLFKCDW